LFSQAGTMGTGEAIPEPPDNGVMIGGDQVVPLGPREGGDRVPDGVDPVDRMTSKGGDGGLCSVGNPGASGSTGALLFAASALLALVARRRR
jgi:MYXO-CTERM domain-containing protein